MTSFKRTNGWTPSRAGNVVHRLELPTRDSRRRRRGRPVDPAVLVPQPPPEPKAPAPTPPPQDEPVPLPGHLHDSQARHQIQLLERRLLKMARLLEQREQEAASRPRVWVDDGVASIYREVQGVEGEDTQASRKKDLMSRIFEQNLKLRERVTSASSGAR